MLFELGVVSPAAQQRLAQQRARQQERLKKEAEHRRAAIEKRKTQQPPLYDPTVRPPVIGGGPKIGRPGVKPIGGKKYGLEYGGYRPGIKGLGDTYSNWYYNVYLPMIMQQQQQRCPAGYTLQRQYDGTVACVPVQQYPYGQSGSYYGSQYGYMSAQQCVAQGGLYDSFSGQCTPRSGAAQYQYPSYYGGQYNYGSQYGYGGGYMSAQQCVAQGGLYDSFNGQCSRPGQATTLTGSTPNVLGVAKWTAVQQLNNAGFAVWLLSENGIPQGTPTDYNPKRVQIVVQNGIVTSMQNG